jgi:hypothetical protein
MKHDLDFRRQELEPIFTKIASGDSVSMIGIGTIGKTILISHFADRDDVQDYLLQALGVNLRHHNLLFVKVDANALLDVWGGSPTVPPALPAAWAGYELLLNRLSHAVQLANDSVYDPLPSPSDEIDRVQTRISRHPGAPGSVGAQRGRFPELVTSINDYYQRVLDMCQTPAAAITAFRLLENALEDIRHFYRDTSPDRRRPRIVFIFDEFERMLELLPAAFFVTLRALRDRFRYLLVYITASRQPITDLVSQYKPNEHEEMSPFAEIFRVNGYVGPYLREADREDMIRRLGERLPPTRRLTPDLKDALLRIGGGHAGLTRTMFDYLSVIQNNNDQASIWALLTKDKVVDELRTMLKSVSPGEQDLLLRLVNRDPIGVDPQTDELLELLMRKHILLKEGGQYWVMPPILAHYLATQAQPPLPR